MRKITQAADAHALWVSILIYFFTSKGRLRASHQRNLPLILLLTRQWFECCGDKPKKKKKKNPKIFDFLQWTRVHWKSGKGKRIGLSYCDLVCIIQKCLAHSNQTPSKEMYFLRKEVWFTVGCWVCPKRALERTQSAPVQWYLCENRSMSINTHTSTHTVQSVGSGVYDPCSYEQEESH